MVRKYSVKISWITIIAVIIAGVIVFNAFNQPANIIGNEFVTMTAITFDDGDLEVHLEILEPSSIQIDGWASWVKFEDGSDSSRTSNNYPGVFEYTVINVYPQKVTIFLEVAGHDTIFNEYFLDRFFIPKNHQPADLLVVEGETSEVITQTTEPEIRASAFGFEYISLIGLAILIINRKKTHEN